MFMTKQKEADKNSEGQGQETGLGFWMKAFEGHFKKIGQELPDALGSGMNCPAVETTL